MNTEIKINLKEITGECFNLSKPGKTCEARFADISELECYDDYLNVCSKTEKYDNKDMARVAALLIEMHSKCNIPEEYIETSEQFAELVKINKKKDVSESRDYVFFAYDCMREIEKLDNKVLCEIKQDGTAIYAAASQDDDISCIVAVNNSEKDIFTEFSIDGLPGRATSIDYYFADEYNQLSIVCNTDTKLETTKILIPMSPYSLHLFKIR